MSSRREQKEQLRRERLAREQAAASAAARRRRLQVGGGVLAALLIGAVIVIAAASGGDGGKSKRGSALAGLETTSAPWQPEYDHLADRLQALNLPQTSDANYHIHAQLRIFVNGKQEPVPANIGIDPGGQFLAPLHTHDASGIVHIESTKPYPFTLGEFFNVWGVKFLDSQLGAYYDQGKNALQVYVNGKRIADPARYVMKRHDSVVVGYGPPRSFPTNVPASFPNGL